MSIPRHGNTECEGKPATPSSPPTDGNTGLSALHDTQEIQRDAAYPLAQQPASGSAFWKLPLPQFLKEAVERAIGGDETEEWQFLFRFVRLVRGYFKEGTKAEAVFDQVDPVIRKSGGWDSYFPDVSDSEEAFAQFVSLWDKVRYRPDETPLTNAIEKATAYPLGTTRGEKRKMPGYDRFVSLAGWLQVTMGDRPILLPCKEVAQVLKTVPKMVSIWRNWAIEEGYLAVVKEHKFHPGGRGQATEFRFDVRRWTRLRKAAQSGTGASFDLAVSHAPEYPEKKI